MRLRKQRSVTACLTQCDCVSSAIDIAQFYIILMVKSTQYSLRRMRSVTAPRRCFMPRRYGRVVQETITNNVDAETGEVSTASQSHTIVYDVEQPFIKLYYQKLLTDYITPDRTMSRYIDFLVAIAGWIDYAGSGYLDEKHPDGLQYEEVFINKNRKELLAHQLGIKTRQVEYIIAEMCRVGIMRRIAMSQYRINPNVIGKGKNEDIVKLQYKWNASSSGIVASTKVTMHDSETCESKTRSVSTNHTTGKSTAVIKTDDGQMSIYDYDEHGNVKTVKA